MCRTRRLSFAAIALATFGLALATAVEAGERDALDREFRAVVRPFLETYCRRCHSGQEPKARFDLSPYKSLASVTGDMGHWKLILERLEAQEMPPKDAPKIPADALRRKVVDWLDRLRRHEAHRSAGDPGPVLARRLSNAEYNYAIHDLTGVDIRPTRDFPVDPANKAGFDNTGESLTMSPALVKKYLAAARRVADHLVLRSDGIEFAPHPVVRLYDRDKFCVHRIVDFYKRQPTDYADYFFAAWRYRHRAALGMPDASLAAVADKHRISAKYLSTIWALLTDAGDDAGPIAELRKQWSALPSPGKDTGRNAAVRAACGKLREFVLAQRRRFRLPVSDQYDVRQLNKSSQPLILWKDRDIAANRRRGRLPKSDGKPETERLRAAIARFCAVFPDVFYVPERGRMFQKEGLDKALAPSKRSSGRLLSAGFHLMFGYFRDDAPLYDLILDGEQQRQLDDMWRELIFVTRAPIRQFSDYIYFERAEFPAFLKEQEFDFAREDTDVTSDAKIKRLAKLYLAKAGDRGIDRRVLKEIDAYFKETSADIRRLEKAIAASEPAHLNALASFAERAWQRPLTKTDRSELLAFYRSLRTDVKLGHADAVRDTLASILMSPRFFYRATLASPGRTAQPLSNHELAGRLSFFLWSSVPDDELRRHAAAGDLHEPQVLIAQTRRMLKDSRARRLAVEFGGNWLDFRRFESHNGVNRERFPQFTDELRQAMYEEPVRFFADLVQHNGSVLGFLKANHTFVNKPLADHYGIPFTGDAQQWIRIDDATPYGRGGLLPMAVFLTKNSPGLRTSPVKRGYWVVRRLLGEHIPPPPPEVPELPDDESKLGERSVRDVLAKHREVQSCAKCHSRFDSIGLAFEGFGPVGEKRKKDLGGRPIDDTAEFPGVKAAGSLRDRSARPASKGRGVEGLRRYLRTSRRDEFVENLCRKLLAYGLGRSLLLSDDQTLQAMRKRLAADDDRFVGLVETIVTSPQFRNARGRDYARTGTQRPE